MELSQTQPVLTEEDAARVLRAGRWLPRLWLGLSAGARLLANPRDTQQVFLLAAAVDRDTLLRNHARMQSTERGRALLKKRPRIDRSGVDYDALRALPEDTLGGAYARMLTRENLDPDLFQAPPGLPVDLAFVAQRIRQTHDLWHVLTGLGTDIASEVALQAFTEEQIHSKTAKLITTFGTLAYGRRFPHMRALSRKYRELGRRAVYLLEVPWEELWEQKLDDVRARLFRTADLPT
jgi:ubiquinone biosynthesis protein COQ4